MPCGVEKGQNTCIVGHILSSVQSHNASNVMFCPEGGPLKYNVVSRRDQENTVKGLFFEIKRCAHAARLGVQNKHFSTKRVPFSKS